MKTIHHDPSTDAFGAAVQETQKGGAGFTISRPGKPRVLLVDDDAVVERIVQASFRNHFEVRTLTSCVDLVYILDSFRPHVIILDIGLPWLDGVEVCKHLRQSTRYRSTPVLFLSALTSAEDIAAGLNAGANGYITKPFSSANLKRRVVELLGRA